MKYQIREERGYTFPKIYDTIAAAMEAVTEHYEESLTEDDRFNLVDEDGRELIPLVYADVEDVADILANDPAFLAMVKMILPGCSAGIDTDPDPLYRLYLLAGDLQANYLLNGYYYDGSTGRVIKHR